ncbi:hypothetical protein EB796_000752 [Bugula neritina]|uniref:Uncharacterized protein n=1 Tax=Bugula neritina TaxID=10212 RepID=A0A7J7KRU2_BUGNE|nr:hypothetical protein EB796_000752 [Bugula neritina]
MMSGVSYVAGCCLLILGSFAAAEIQLKIHWTGSNGTRQIFTPKEFAKLSEEDRTEHRLTKRNAIKDYKYLWHLGVVYYDIDARTAGEPIGHVVPCHGTYHTVS